MFPSQKKIINAIIEHSIENKKSEQQTLSDVQLGYAYLYHHYILLTILNGAICIFGIAFAFGLKNLSLISAWAIVTSIIIFMLFFNSSRVANTGKVSIQKLQRYMFMACSLMGLTLTAGFALTVYNESGLKVEQFSYKFFGYVMFMLITYMIAIGGLSYKFRYVVIFVGASLIAPVTYLLNSIDILFKQPYFYLFASIFISIYFLVSREEQKNRAKNTNLYIKHKKLLNEAQQQKDIAEKNERLLAEEINARSEIENQLYEMNLSLEKQVKDRTLHITQINKNLLSSKKSMEMAHEAAGMASWEWDVASKRLTGKNFDYLLGFNKDEVQVFLDNVNNMMHPDDLVATNKALSAYLKNTTQKFKAAFRIKNKAGDWVWLDCLGITVSRDADTKRAEKMVGICRDITLEKSVSDSLKLSNSVFEQSAEAIFVLDANMNYVSINPSYEQILQYHIDDLEGKFLFLKDKDNKDKEDENLHKILTDIKHHGEFSGEVTERNKSGERVFIHLFMNEVRNDDGDITNYIGIFSDLTQQTMDKQRLSYLSNYDPLTDLPNRSFFNQQLHTLLTDKSEKFAVIRLNIDRFRFLNNSLGSAIADLLLKQISERLSRLDYSVRALARIGGDDFAVLLNHLSLHSLKAYLDSILKAFEQPFFIEKNEINVRLSIGVSLYPQHGHQVDSLINRAEQGLKRAKLNGGNEYFIYNQGLHVSSLDKLQLENELRHALNKGELSVFFQPKVSLRTSQLIGFEALVRWYHPTKGLLLPGDFINIAEETGLMHDLGLEVLTQTCNQIRKWQDLGMKDLKVAVNIEVQQLKRSNFLSILDQVMEKADLHGHMLEIEITESSLMDIPEQIKPLLAAIKARNITVALDDFGTGYSSLAYLSQYPIDVIKIDRSFIDQASSSNESAAIVRAIIALGHSLDMKLVAEGVETKNQIEFLRKEGCHIAQGWYYGKALPSDQATRLVERTIKG